MTDTITETTPNKSAFASRSQRTNLDKVEDLEKEILELEKQNSAPVEEIQEPTQDAPQEGLSEKPEPKDNWQKRYSDLRKHLSTKEKEWTQKLEDLSNQLKTQSSSELPKTKEEVEKWVKKHPDVARIVRALAKEEADNTGKEVDSRIKQLEELKEQISLEKAKADLLKLHPDFDTISESEDFAEWVDSAPKWVQTAIYDDLDVASAASAIKLYKVEKGIKPRNSDKDAASAVKVPNTTTPIDDESKAWLSESKVAKMTDREYEAKEEEIFKAMRDGKFIYDLQKR
jgi:phage host-nuclease inhibitor protein Gam